MGPRVLQLAMALALLTLPAVPVHSGEADPLRGGALQQPPEEAGQGRGPLAGIGRVVLKWQQEMNRELGRSMRAIRDGESSMSLLIGVAVAFLYGVIHALGPGHGKYVVVSYFLSKEARPWRGLWMGLQISVTHVISAIVLMWVANLSLRHVLSGSTTEIQAVRLASYGVTAAIGAFMLVKAVKNTPAGQGIDGPCGGGNAPDRGTKQQGIVSFSLGLVPCTGAILVMLFAIANDILVSGIAMVAAIGVGMALTMTALGLLGMGGRRLLLSRWEVAGVKHARLRRALESAGAAAILLVSSVLFLSAL
jgi:ABC-type nickel/cobalt efflux system permease component RcnA